MSWTPEAEYIFTPIPRLFFFNPPFWFIFIEINRAELWCLCSENAETMVDVFAFLLFLNHDDQICMRNISVQFTSKHLALESPGLWSPRREYIFSAAPDLFVFFMLKTKNNENGASCVRIPSYSSRWLVYYEYLLSHVGAQCRREWGRRLLY
jgi:hypothetical protein